MKARCPNCSMEIELMAVRCPNCDFDLSEDTLFEEVENIRGGGNTERYVTFGALASALILPYLAGKAFSGALMIGLIVVLLLVCIPLTVYFGLEAYANSDDVLDLALVIGALAIGVWYIIRALGIV